MNTEFDLSRRLLAQLSPAAASGVATALKNHRVVRNDRPLMPEPPAGGYDVIEGDGW